MIRDLFIMDVTEDLRIDLMVFEELPEILYRVEILFAPAAEQDAGTARGMEIMDRFLAVQMPGFPPQFISANRSPDITDQIHHAIIGKK